jgi:hypothetical protein
MLRCSRNETISKFENFFDNLILHVFTSLLLSHCGSVVASFSSTTLLGFVSFLIYIKFIFYKFKTIVKLFVVILRKFGLKTIVDANNINIIEKLCLTSSYVFEV